MNIFYLLFSILALEFLVFIHELGHYFMALKYGMRVEEFSIGFGKAILQWKWNGVNWKLGLLPFGGYVKIGGMEKEGDKEPHEIKDGFFGKSWIARIVTSSMGPLVNLAFAFFVFMLLWLGGGRERFFSEFTQKIGYIEPKSELHELGIESGDALTNYNKYEVTRFQDLFLFSILKHKEAHVKGFIVDYQRQIKTPFEHKIELKKNAAKISRKDFSILGISAPASYLIYDRINGKKNELSATSPMLKSGIQYGDRILWANGELLFSFKQFDKLINSEKLLVTIKRDSQTRALQIPRVKIASLKLSPSEKEEIRDWVHDLSFDQQKGQSLEEFYYLPYQLSSDCTVLEKAASALGQPEKPARRAAQTSLEDQLLEGDQILAINGQAVRKKAELFSALQKREMLIIVERGVSRETAPWSAKRDQLNESLNWASLATIFSSIGTENPIETAGHLVLLAPITPQKDADIHPDLKEKVNALLAKKEITEEAASLLKNRQGLGIALQDQKVIYNPTPWTLFKNGILETFRTLKSLVSGALNPKWLSGPVGIVKGVYSLGMGWGFKEAFYWVGVISLNLGFFNLLPLLPLDGGYILLALLEKLIRRPIKAKVLEKLVMPFVILLIGLIIFVTFQDLGRIWLESKGFFFHLWDVVRNLFS